MSVSDKYNVSTWVSSSVGLNISRDYLDLFCFNKQKRLKIVKAFLFAFFKILLQFLTLEFRNVCMLNNKCKKCGLKCRT